MQSSSLSPIEQEFLRELYQLNFTDGLSQLDYGEWLQNRGIGYDDQLRSHQRLMDSKFAKGMYLGMSTTLTDQGIQYLEVNGLVDEELAAKQDKVRRLVLKRLDEEYQTNGSFGRIYADRLEWEVDVSREVLERNLSHLEASFLIEREYGGLSITEIGRQVVAAFTFYDRIEDRWKELCAGESMKPQARGHALEDLLTDLARHEGFQVEPRARSIGEENDLVLSRGHEHFIVSCKWEKKRAPNQYLESLRMRILKRPGSLGMLVSVGGFSKELVQEAEGNTSLGMVMLFGRGDLDRLFTAEAKLRDLMEERHAVLARYRRVLFTP